jgi:translocation protein SEC63
VIASYSLFVGILLPWFVGSWWAGARTYTKTGIHQKTAGRFFEACDKDQPHFVTYDKILAMLADSEEFRILVPNLNKQDIKQLLLDHLDRKVVAKEHDKMVVVSRSVSLLDGLLDIASAFKNFGLCQRIIEVKRCIIQAVPIKSQSAGEILQLPGVNLTDSHITTKQDLDNDTLKLAQTTIPKLHFLKGYFKVPGETVIPPQAQAHVIVKFMVIPFGSNVPDIDDKLLMDAPEEDETAKVLRDPLSTNELAPAIPDVCAPYFPGSYKPIWYGFIVNERDGKIIDGPVEMKRVSYDNLKLSSEELADGSNITIGTFKIQLSPATPPQAGMTFPFKVMLLSSGYFGCDIVESVPMVIENPPVVAETEDYDISEPEEDSVAGAVSQLRGAPVKKTPKKEQDDDSSDEEEDLSDIDTDTSDEEDEEDVKKK